jgi:site-specific DNA-methyltransferase (cytosine-N4-specific)
MAVKPSAYQTLVSLPASESEVGYSTKLGKMFVGKAEQVLGSRASLRWKGKFQLIFTSPPFPLNNKKSYGNLVGNQYAEWLASYARLFREFLKPQGSIVLELGNGWEPGRPVMSTLALRALLAFLDAADLRLCQEFICYNPARLPSPAQWVTVKRIRVKDAYTRLWWMSTVDSPQADNRRVLRAYSSSMLRLLKSGTYNSGRRPSGHHIGHTSFLRKNPGAIPSNVLIQSNTNSKDVYQQYCRDHGLTPHPARMSAALATFFVRFLTRPGNIVLDPFAGSNTTGAIAESLGRRWVSIEPNADYVSGSIGRFSSDRVRRSG